MHRLLATALLFAAPCALACSTAFPEQVALSANAAQVEVVSEAPAEDAYVEVGNVEGAAMANERADALTQARNALRNDASRRGATIVTVTAVDASRIWDRNKTLVRVTGVAYRSRD